MKRCIQLLLCIICLSLYLGCATSQLDDESFTDSPENSTDISSRKDSAAADFSGDDLSSDDMGGAPRSKAKSKNNDLNFDDQGSVQDDFSQGEKEIMSENNNSSGKSPKKKKNDFMAGDEMSQPPKDDSDPLLEEDLAAQNKKSMSKKDSSEGLPPPTDDFMAATPETPPPAPMDNSNAMSTEAPPAAPSTNMGSSAVSSGAGQIKNIRFESNDGGGTVVIEGNQPLVFTSRFNEQTKQYVIEITNVSLPNSLKRPYNTKDFQGPVGSIDAYQSPGSDTARIVVQMKEGASEPSVQQEGNNILVISGNANQVAKKENDDQSFEQDNSGDESINGNKGILSSANLQEFLASNMKFYGKKISLEMKDISVREAINMISEESGANLVMTESVSGNLSIKLREVPWDQALVMILKAKKLAYTRQGNVLRITAISDIRQEEDDALKFAESKRKIDPLIVQMIPINYAKTEDLKAQVSTLTSERGKVVADARTNAIIVTDTEEVLERIKKMVAGLDIAPAQVLIEAKIVEARESFEKKIGIQWDMFGQDTKMSGSNSTIMPTLSIHPGVNKASSLGFSLKIGNIDLLGDLNSMLALEEREDNVKVISSPRILALHNETASITQSSQIPIIVGGAVNTTSNTGSIFATRSRDVVYKNLQMHLKVTPQIANNGSVSLSVDVKREFPGPITDEQSGAAPIHSREAQTKVIVKNGQTAVIGGIYQNDTRNSDSGVPVLKDIPILGYLFRTENVSKDKTELLLFLTPRIISQPGSTQVSGKDISNIEVQ